MRDFLAKHLAALAAAAVLLAGFVVALWPEPDARLLTPAEGWTLSDTASIGHPAGFGVQWRQVRSSILQNPEARIARNYTGERGTQPAEIVSPPFRAEGIVSVLIAGSTAAPDGSVETVVSCAASGERLPVGRGGVNVNVSEALLRIPKGWCAGDLTLRQVSTGDYILAGVGSVSALSPVSAWKISFLGLLPYLALSFLMMAGAGAAGALALRRVAEPALGAAAGIGALCLAAFFLHALAPRAAASLTPLYLIALVAAAFLTAPRGERRETLRALAPLGFAWFAVAFFCFALLTLAYNGAGHWEPNYRFIRADGASDNELPWMFAEALRHGWDIQGLFGGGWRPTDRPPLMTGGHLLVADLFSAMFSAGNDGRYLRGEAYNASAIVQNALWAPAMLFLLTRTVKLAAARALSLVAVAAVIPFFLYNTIYGWPKLMGAAFALLATSVAIDAARRPGEGLARPAVLFGAFGAFSVLAHASNAFYLAPLGLWFFAAALWKRPAALAAGVAAGLALLVPWAAYQHFVAPSDGPLLKYALAGDFGFGRPEKGLRDWMAEKYASLTVAGWLKIKAAVAGALFFPSSPHLAAGLARDSADLGAMLRRWDFHYLTIGNLGLLAGLAALLFPKSGAGEAERGLRRDAGLLATLAAASFALMALVSFPDLVIHQSNYAMLAVLAAASLGAASARPRFFAALAAASASYSLVVWGAAPLFGAMRVDWTALAVPAVLAVAAAPALAKKGPVE